MHAVAPAFEKLPARHYTLKLARLVALLFVAFAAKSASAADHKLVLAMLNSATQTPYYVAVESGLYKQYGLDIVPVQFSGGAQAMMALLAGDVQINTSGGPAAINARLKGGNIAIIGTNVGVFPYVLYVAPGINKPQDLKGKRVGLAGFGGVTHFAMIYALKKLGLNPDSDVNMTALGSAGLRLASVVSGTTAATLVQPPESLKAKELGLKPMLDLARSGIKFPSNQLTTTGDFIQNNRDAAKRFLMGCIAGLAKLRSDRPYTTKVMQKYLRISEPKLLNEAYDYWASIYAPKFYSEPEAIETYFALTKINAKPQEMIDNSLLSDLDRDGFFDQMNRKYGVQ
jgi:NitT/TauT family transport system substrate-binding protein